MTEPDKPPSETKSNIGPDLIARIDDMKQRVRWAAEVAAVAGDFKEMAFSKVLDHLFEQTLSSGNIEERVKGQGPSEESSTRRRPGGGNGRRSPKADGATLERIRPMLEAPPDLTSEFATKIAQVPAKVQIYAALEFAAEKFGIARLTTAELREVLRQVLRIGMPDGTLRGILSKAPPAEIGRVQNGGGETSYQLMHAGKELLGQSLVPTSDSPSLP
jgi:hypothetical protein